MPRLSRTSSSSAPRTRAISIGAATRIADWLRPGVAFEVVEARRHGAVLRLIPAEDALP
jgi:hypothetical protein